MGLEFARRGHEVFWIESRYLRWLIDRPRDFFRARAERPARGIEVQPITLINGERLSFIRNSNKNRLASRFNSAIRNPQSAIVLWLYNPHEGHLAESVRHDLLVYDIMDEYAGFPWSPPRIVEEEADLLARADWVFAGTGALYDSKKDKAPGKIECLLSGVDVAHFAAPESGFVVPPSGGDPEFKALREKYKHVAGYAGMIDLRLDQALVAEAARALPEWGFVFIGPVVENVDALRGVPNVHFIGARPYGSLPSYYHAFDAALLPFVENPLTRHINPTKMLEYAAAGVPIVARALPEIERFYADGAWLYNSNEDFIRILRSLEPPSPDSRKLAAAQAWVADRSWDAIAQKMLDRVEGLISRD
ncbi:MAG: glycosyltransferase [Candidatus Sumerlaeia bacterium]